MNLQPLFEMQEPLDLEILTTKKLEGQNLHDEKFVAIHTELGEAMNEHREFKYWSEDRKPRTKLFRIRDSMGKEDVLDFNPNEVQNGFFPEVKEFNPLLEELVDVLHFLLSIGNDIDAGDENLVNFVIAETTVERQHLEFVYTLVQLEQAMRMSFADPIRYYKMAFAAYVNLTGLMGFTWQQISDAYKLKNAENHRRQQNGY